MSFLYFIPGGTESDSAADLIKRHALDDRIRKADVGVVRQNGPDGGAGLVLVDSSYQVSPRVDLRQQTWRPAPKRGADAAPYWVGYWNDRVPCEENLRRVKTLPGDQIELRDGAKWTIPKLIEFVPPESVGEKITYNAVLPKVLDVDDDGDLVSGKIEPRYQDLWERGWDFHYSLAQQARETGRAVMTDLDARRFAVQLLGVNYRLTAVEIAMLGLLGDALPAQIVISAIDNSTFWAAVKNRVGRLDLAITNLPSGVERPNTESPINIPTGQPSAN